jgi:hypothetical protein
MSDDTGFDLDKVFDTDPNENFGFVELPSGWNNFVAEVLEVKRQPTSQGDGTLVRVTVRCCDKKFSSNRAWGSYYVATTNPDKVEGAKNGARAYAKLANACGFVLPKALKEDKVKKALQIGLVEELDRAEFKSGDIDQKLVGKFFKAGIYVKERHPDNPDEPIYPELRSAEMIDLDQFDDVVKAAKETKKKETKPKTDEPPF